MKKLFKTSSLRVPDFYEIKLSRYNINKIVIVNKSNTYSGVFFVVLLILLIVPKMQLFNGKDYYSIALKLEINVELSSVYSSEGKLKVCTRLLIL